MTRFTFTAALLALGALPAAVSAQVVFDFEDSTPFTAANSSLVIEGDTDAFVSSSTQAIGTKSLKIDQSVRKSFESFTYDEVTGMESGTITVWFYDTVGTGSDFTWRGSVILEDANNPSDFGAVEVAGLPYGGMSYYGTEGSTDRQLAADKFDSGTFPVRSIGWHRVDFNVAPSGSTISVDGTPSVQVGAPGSLGTSLRLRFMADSASAGGFGNWTAAASGFPAAAGALLYDDITFTETAPTAEVVTYSFEDAELVDAAAVFMGPAAENNSAMQGFVNTFATSTAQAHAGTNSAVFANGTPTFRGFEVDLSDVEPGTISISFYDTLGANTVADKIGGAIMIESGADASNFMAAEIWNFTYPTGFAPGYYLTARPIAFGSGFHSRYFGARSVGWQTLTIEITETYSRFQINGVGADLNNGSAVYDGPGLSTNPKLRIMIDSPTLGGFMSWKNNTGWVDSETPELNVLYADKSSEYLYFDNLSLPSKSGVEDWSIH